MKRIDLKKISGRQYRDIVIIALLVYLAVWDKMRPRTVHREVVTASADVGTQYCAAPISDTSNDVVGYELHHYAGSYGKDYECFAIVRKLDPAKDDYKQMSRAVIGDIIKRLDTDNISVTIYDDNEAYELGEKQNIRYIGAKQEETDKVFKHIVACFDNEHEYSSTSRLLTYYTYAANKYTEQSAY